MIILTLILCLELVIIISLSTGGSGNGIVRYDIIHNICYAKCFNLCLNNAHLCVLQVNSICMAAKEDKQPKGTAEKSQESSRFAYLNEVLCNNL